MSTPKLDAFTRAYITAALFTEDPDPGQGEYCEHDDWTVANIEPDSLARMVADCEHFQNVHYSDIESDLEHAGRDFWYTRNGHGCGFWDGDWPEDIGDRLTQASKTYGEQYLYLGDDGKLYVG